MPTLEAGPFADLIPATDLIGGENGAPAYQVVGGRFSEIPQAEVNTPTALGAFADLIPAGTPSANSVDISPFDDLIPKPESDTEKALDETPTQLIETDRLIAIEKGLGKGTGMPIHEAMNAVRVFGSAAGRYIFNGLQGFELNRAKLLANPTPEMVQPQGDEIILPDGSAMSKEQQQALEDHYTRESQAGVPAALANAEYFKLRAARADEQSFVDPELSDTIPARLAGAAGQAAIMGLETLIPGAGIPLLVMHGALATEAEARNSGKSEAEAEAAGVRSAIGLAIFGGASKLASLGVAKLLPSVVRDPSKLVTFIAQFTGQETANEASSRAIAGWNAAAEAPEGQKVQAAIEAMKDTTLEQTTLNAVFAVMGASKAAGRTVRPATEPEPRPAIEPQPAEVRPQGVEPVAPKAPISEPIGITSAIAEIQRRNAPTLKGKSDVPEPQTLGLGPQPRGNESLGRARESERVGVEEQTVPRIAETNAAQIRSEVPETVVPQNLRRNPEIDRLINEPAAPRLLSGEKQGDLISSTQSEPFTLIGEKGVDFSARQATSAKESRAREEARLKEESEQGLLEEFREHQRGGGDELLTALKSEGGLPALSSARSEYAGELRNVREEVRSPSRKEPISYADVFRKDAPDIDALTHRLRAKGFNVETPGELLDLVRDRIRTGRQIFGNESTGGMAFEPAMEGGAMFSAGGRRFTVKPKGTTPSGDRNFLRIEPPLKRAFKGLERKGAADVIGETKNKVGKLLAEATTKHVDTEQELFGQISTELIRPIKAVSKTTADKAFDEAAVYFAAKENGRPLPALSPAAKGLVTGWENIAERTGQIAAANGVQVFDPATNTHRPMHVIGRQYVPRMFKSEVERVMRDPNSNPRLWNDLVDELALHRGITDVEAANQLRAEAGRFSSNDFMGNLEMARTGKMPESFYEYDLRNLAAKYIPNFSERMAQIISYGQRLGPRENPQRPNLWDIARKEAGDSYTQDWLNNAENQAVNLRQQGTAATGMARAQTAASGLLLSSPTTTVIRNLLSGTSATPELLGVRRSMKGFADTIKSSQARMDAREIGTVRDNIADFLHADRLGDSPIDNAIRSVVDAGLKYSGYNGSEVFVRTHGTATASQFAKDAVTAINKNPASMRSKEALGLFKRTGVSPEKIVAENADWKAGPETRKFIRTFVRDTQGGYRFDQVPLWANSNMGRFFYQFGRWGTQRARNIWKNGIQPALGEEVQWHGKTMTRRDIRPLAKILGTTVVLGETFAGIAQLLFGRDRRDASLSEIAEAWKEDEKKAVGLAFERVINDLIMAGTLGIWSQPIDWAKGLKNQSRLKNPTEPPGLSSIKSTMELGQAMLDQDGQVTKRDLLKFASSFAPGAKQVTDVARNVMDEPLYEAENDVRTLRNAAHRWATAAGMDVSPKAKGSFRKSAMAPDYEPIKEALLVGDSERAKFLANSFLDQQSNRSQALKNLRSSIRNSQPFRAGPYAAKVHRDNFREWARKNLNEQDRQQVERIQERYQRSAVAALLW